MPPMRRPLALALALLVAGCATNPVTGDAELMLVSEDEEVELGRDGDREVVAQFGLVDDPALQAWVDQLGQGLARVGHRPGVRFTFRVLDHPAVNAFALPGGYVYVTRGLLPYLRDEGALAFVLGHEVGHVTSRHAAQRLTRDQLLGLGIGVASLLGERFDAVSGLASAGARLLLLKYSRDDERQADELGVEYGAKAGHDTTGGGDLFSALAALSTGRGGLPPWSSTHPDPGERRDTVRALSRRAQAERGAPAATSRLAYVRRLEGLVFGDDPRQGFVEAGWVLHPQLRFRVPLPGSWTAHNLASQMQLVAPDGARAMVVTLAAGEDPAAAAAAFAAHEGIEAEDPVELTIQGLRAVRLDSTLPAREGDVAIVSTFLARDGRVFAFHGLCEQDDLRLARPTLVAIPDGFAALTEPRALAIRPAVLHGVEAARTGIFRDLVADWPIPEGVAVDLTGLAHLNAVAPEETVAQGTPLLVLVRR